MPVACGLVGDPTAFEILKTPVELVAQPAGAKQAAEPAAEPGAPLHADAPHADGTAVADAAAQPGELVSGM